MYFLKRTYSDSSPSLQYWRNANHIFKVVGSHPTSQMNHFPKRGQTITPRQAHREKDPPWTMCAIKQKIKSIY